MIIVTGGAGFIGSNIIKALNNIGITQIIVVDNLSNSSKHLNLNSLKIADYIDKDDFIKTLSCFKGVKTIFHQGACSNTMETDGRYMMKNNYEYSKDLLHFALNNGIDMVYASTAAIYGNGDNGFSEKAECESPLNVYAYSKLIFDNYVRRLIYTKSHIDSQVCGLRYFNVYGYQENHKGNMASVPFHLMTQLKKGQAMKLFKGSEGFKRDFIFVDDVVRVNMYMYDKRINGVFNCGTGKAQSFMDIAKTFQDLNPNAKIEMIPFPEALKNKYQFFTEADITSLRKTGYKASFQSLESGLQQYYELFQKTNGYFQ